MPNTIQIKRNTSGVPSGLQAGELAVNLSDSKLYVGNAAANGVLHLNNHLPLAGGTISGGLTVSGTANFGGSYTNFGGGYGATGVSITSAGNIQANGTLTVDAGLSVAGSSSFQGAAFTSAVSISTGTNNLLALNPAISTGGSLTSLAFQRGSTNKWHQVNSEPFANINYDYGHRFFLWKPNGRETIEIHPHAGFLFGNIKISCLTWFLPEFPSRKSS